ncbi:MAG TPA: GNAT family N-acetyltransferase [Flavisolibacter sp.]|jgi:ribosomal protein S18 acetylase RimI-like enzyme
MGFSIREATIDDAVLIADISRQTFYDSFAADNTKENMDKFLREQFTRGKLMLEVGTRDTTFLLAYHNSEIAGYLKLRDGRKPAALSGMNVLEIARLYALSTMIGKGVGRLLMQKSIGTAQERNKEAVWLGVWEKNHRAIDFYTRWGFEKFGEQDFLLGDDVQNDWLMMRRV